MTYKPRFFQVTELVSKSLYASLEDDAISLFKPNVLMALDLIRVNYGKPLIINNWANGGNYENSGLREKCCEIGAKASKHKDGIAFDLKASDINELKLWIKNNGSKFFIHRVENYEHTPTWVHIEIGDYLKDSIYFFNP